MVFGLCAQDYIKKKQQENSRLPSRQEDSILKEYFERRSHASQSQNKKQYHIKQMKLIKDFHRKMKMKNGPYMTELEIQLCKERFKKIPPQKIISIKHPQMTEEPKFIGNGSYGNVFQGFCTKKQIPFAMKKIHKRFLNDEQKKIVLQEVNLLKKLNHPNIVKFKGFDEDNNYYKIYMEFMEEGSVQSMLKQFGPFKESVVKNYLRQIVEGLEYLHCKDLIHRDIKGDNILVKSNGTVKIGDIGSTRKIQSEKVKSFVGTGCWMAPEVIKGVNYDQSADIWSLGCTVFEMLTGKPPFDGQNQFAILDEIINFNEKTFVYPPGLTQQAVSFIRSCLVKNPKHRPNTLELRKHPFIKSDDKQSILSLQTNSTFKTHGSFNGMTKNDSSSMLSTTSASKLNKKLLTQMSRLSSRHSFSQNSSQDMSDFQSEINGKEYNQLFKLYKQFSNFNF